MSKVLFRKLRRLEAAAGVGGEGDYQFPGFAWAEVREAVDPAQLGDGDSIASDVDVVMIMPRCDGGWTLTGEVREADFAYDVRQRITRDPADLGLVRFRGREIGRVLELGSAGILDLGFEFDLGLDDSSRELWVVG